MDDTVIGYIVNSLKKYNVDYVYGGMYFQREGKIIRCWSQLIYVKQKYTRIQQLPSYIGW